MTNQEFIFKIIEEYKDARKLKFGNAGFNIKRGMSHSISGISEDLFSVFIAEKLNDKSLELYVDKPISIRLPNHTRAKTFKPDLFILKDGVMTHYFDLKMDLGWKRNIEAYLIERNTLIEHLKVLSASGEKAWIQDWGEKQVSISQNLSYQIVVLSSGNINKNLLDQNYQIAQKLEHIQMYILTQGSHLNMYREDDIYKLIINDFQFDRLFFDTKTALEF